MVNIKDEDAGDDSHLNVKIIHWIYWESVEKFTSIVHESSGEIWDRSPLM